MKLLTKDSLYNTIQKSKENQDNVNNDLESYNNKVIAKTNTNISIYEVLEPIKLENGPGSRILKVDQLKYTEVTEANTDKDTKLLDSVNDVNDNIDLDNYYSEDDEQLQDENSTNRNKKNVVLLTTNNKIKKEFWQV